MSIRTWIKKTFSSSVSTIKSGFDIRDLFVFGGLAMMGYGLHLFRPWIGWAVTGAILISFGLFIGKRGK